MSFWNWLTRRRDDHGWPGYIINGRIRTSTAALIVAFFVIAWLHNTYQPAASTAPETAQVVPPGFMPDPAYTWVPRTNVRTQPRSAETTPTTPTTTSTTETSPTETTSPTDTTGPTTSGPSTATTIIDPDGSGPLPPTTVTQTPVTSPGAPIPNRSGTSTTTTTTVIPGTGQASTTPLAPG
ncbi:hypothetical protein [Mycolicibacterium hodleri]|uniref:hypothetical protein n=1 Tax=Mycolicibacterium hodleri TaxID=49897 RepID=UPI001F3F91AB|nr:hypothetical protein [Mycolicibacterium hodleri]